MDEWAERGRGEKQSQGKILIGKWNEISEPGNQADLTGWIAHAIRAYFKWTYPFPLAEMV